MFWNNYLKNMGSRIFVFNSCFGSLLEFIVFFLHLFFIVAFEVTIPYLSFLLVNRSPKSPSATSFFRSETLGRLSWYLSSSIQPTVKLKQRKPCYLLGMMVFVVKPSFRTCKCNINFEFCRGMIIRYNVITVVWTRYAVVLWNLRWMGRKEGWLYIYSVSFKKKPNFDGIILTESFPQEFKPVVL